MQSYRYFLLAFFLCFSFSYSSAQVPNQTHFCGTDLESELKDPAKFRNYQQFQANMREFIQNRPSEVVSEKTSENPNATKYVIPCVVHVVYNNPADSVDYAQVYSAMETLFNDYRRVPGTRGVGGGGSDASIEFTLASIDPQGNPTNGVKYYRVSADKTNFATSGADNVELKTVVAPSWDTQKYFNIWVVQSIAGGGGGGRILGYAQFPFTYFESATTRRTDGFVCVNEHFGTVGTSDRYISVVTHELGHCLNLFHTFQGCGTNCQTMGDNICDTPPSDKQFSNPYERNNSCQETPTDRPDNPRNYMDYTNPFDAQNYFSREQVGMFHSVMDNTRNVHRFNLWQKSNLEATGAGKNMKPKANFAASKRNACVGQEVTFTDYTMGMPKRWEWEFPGGEPATSTSANPTVKFNRPGGYTVKMKVWNDSPTPDSVTKIAFIRVVNAADVTVPSPYKETFNTIGSRDFPVKGWYLTDSDSGFPGSEAWALLKRVNGYARTEAEGSGCLRYNHFQHSQYGMDDAFVTPIIQTGSSARIKFDVAYSMMNYIRPGTFRTLYSDTLVLYAASGCGDNWTQIGRWGGSQLQTVARTYQSNAQGDGGDFSEPKANEWITRSVNVPSALLSDSAVRFKFETWSGFGNNLYIDNITVDNLVSAEEALEDLTRIEVYPNPTDGNTRLHVNLPAKADFSWELYDLNGRKVAGNKISVLSPGEHTIEVPVQHLTDGVYSLQVRINDRLKVQKVVKY